MVDRMLFHHHKYALTLTILLVAIIGVLLGVQVLEASGSTGPLVILTFGFVMLLLVINFIMLSMLLRSREDAHQLHEELMECVKGRRAKKK